MQQVFKDEVLKGGKQLSDIIVVPQSSQIKDFIGTIN